MDDRDDAELREVVDERGEDEPHTLDRDEAVDADVLLDDHPVVGVVRLLVITPGAVVSS